MAKVDGGTAEVDAGGGSEAVGRDAAPPADATSQLTSCSCIDGRCDAAACSCASDSALCDVSDGTGADGTLVVSVHTNLSTTNHAGRSCSDGGDAVAYSVVELPSASQARLSVRPASDCLVKGDEVLLINLQGTASSSLNTGHMELLRVAEIEADTVTFVGERAQIFGGVTGAESGLGTLRTQQRVLLQRVPNYTELRVVRDQTLTANAWDGVRGGVLALRVQGRAEIAGTLDMVGRGYTGGTATTAAGATGLQGESIAGLGAASKVANGGGGGGGAGDVPFTACDPLGTSGGGGGHVQAGSSGSAPCSGGGGLAYATSERVFLGAGGGAGGTDNSLRDNPPGAFGGAGGGIILLFAREVTVTGAIDASGAPGQGDVVQCTGGSSTVSCWDYSGPGGGGAGGSIHLTAKELVLGESLVRSLGGPGGRGIEGLSGNGGAGSVGTVVASSVASVAGTTAPAFSVSP